MPLPLFCLLAHLLGATDPAAPQSDAREVSFLGFAANEAALAWKVRHQQRFADGSVDTFTVVRLLSTSEPKLLATFLLAPLRHHPAPGRAALQQAALRRRHPDLAGAASAASWRKLRRQGRFASIAHDFGDVVVRLGADQDSKMQAEGEGKKKRLKVQAKDKGALGFTAICRLFEGEMVALGHFRAEPSVLFAPPLRAEFHVYYSHTGHLVAGLNTFFDANGRRGSSEGVLMVTPENDPLGATGVGMLQMVENQSRSFYNDYNRMHPRSKGIYEQYVGKWF